MGWKAACIITGDFSPAYLSEMPEHLPDRADEIYKEMGYERYTEREESEFEVYPEQGTVVIGAFEKAIVLADQDIIFDCFENREHAYFKKALSLYPQGKLLMVVLHSVVDYFGYAYYENGVLVRELSGTAEDGVQSEVGEPQPEEQAIYARSKIVDGERVITEKRDWAGPEQFIDQSLAMFGEDLTFAIMQKVVACPFDQSIPGEHYELKMEQFHKGDKLKIKAASDAVLQQALKSSQPDTGAKTDTVFTKMMNGLFDAFKKK